MSESYSQVPELGKRENGGERESYGMQECHATQPNYEHCKYSTNRGWRDISRYAELFGTPERAARTLSIMQRCELGIIGNCDDCEMHDACRVRDGDYDALLEWLRGDAE